MVNRKLWVNGQVTQTVANQKVGSAAHELSRGTEKLGVLTGQQGTSKWGHEEGAEQVRSGFATVLQEISSEVGNIQRAFEEYKKSVAAVVANTEAVDDAALADFNKVATDLMKPATVITTGPPLETSGTPGASGDPGTGESTGRGSFGAGHSVPAPQPSAGR